MLRVYLAGPCETQTGEIYPEERKNYVFAAENGQVVKLRYSVWKLLERAVEDTYGRPMNSLKFTFEESGKWTCESFCFSLSHTRGMVVAAISNGGVGADVESISAFEKRMGRPSFARALRERLGAQGCADKDLIKRWTQWESEIKLGGKNLSCGAEYLTFGDFLIAVCAERGEKAKFFLCDEKDGAYCGGKEIFNG